MRILNNGILGDAQIYKRNISRPASLRQSNYSQEDNENNILEQDLSQSSTDERHSLELDELLADTSF